MPKRTSKLDTHQNAARVFSQATQGEYTPPALPKAKNPAAVMLGRLGGLKGGPARAAALTKARRREIGRKAAQARWGEGAKG